MNVGHKCRRAFPAQRPKFSNGAPVDSLVHSIPGTSKSGLGSERQWHRGFDGLVLLPSGEAAYPMETSHRWRSIRREFANVPHGSARTRRNQTTVEANSGSCWCGDSSLSPISTNFKHHGRRSKRTPPEKCVLGNCFCIKHTNAAHSQVSLAVFSFKERNLMFSAAIPACPSSRKSTPAQSRRPNCGLCHTNTARPSAHKTPDWD
jgi:hypothetical protein